MQLPSPAPGVRWSICVRDAKTSQVLAEHEPDRVQRTASIGKLFLLVEVSRRAEAGDLDLDEVLAWEDEDLITGSGLWYLMRSRALPIDDLCWLVGGFSDNLATNVLVRRIGIPAVAAGSEALGFTRSSLLDRIRKVRGPDDPPTLSQGCAGELSDLLARLHRGSVVSPGVSRQVLRWAAANADLSMVAAGFGLDPLDHAAKDRGVLLVNKTGTIDTVRADVGVVRGSAGAVAYAVLAEWDAGADPRDDVLAYMAEVGQRLRTHVLGPS